MSLLSSLAMISGTLTSLAILPQAIKIFRRKSASDISIFTYSFMLVNAVIWMIYGLEIKNASLLLANSTAILSLFLVTLAFVFLWKKN
jgi:MtN3 and saliva related transmembrane protein